jgi:hypothetical protein
MTRRRWIVAVLLAACAALVVVVLVILLFASGGSVTQANFDRIEIGMTLNEVEAILGGRAERSVGSKHLWTGTEGRDTLVVEIDVDAEEKVIKTKLHKIQMVPLNRILHRLGFSIL